MQVYLVVVLSRCVYMLGVLIDNSQLAVEAIGITQRRVEKEMVYMSGNVTLC